jgi:hypothetical protein
VRLSLSRGVSWRALFRIPISFGAGGYGGLRRLVTCDPWPEEAAKGDGVARLALLRLLWLQGQVHRSVVLRQREAAALLARSMVELCITGLWALGNDQAPKALGGRDSPVVPRLLAPLISAGIFSKRTADVAVTALSTGVVMPSIRDIAVQADRRAGNDDAVVFYDKFYAPLSHFYAHANGFALTRHGFPSGKLRLRPVSIWPLRAPARLADGCVGTLAAAVAGEQGSGMSTWAAPQPDEACL